MRKHSSGDYNSGNCNSGNCNSGDWNSGDWNSGDWNSGYRNSGNLNSGNRNNGDWNNGDRNSGDRNSGNRNSGDWNSGDWNSGDWNSGYRNSGYRNSGNLNSGNRNSGDWNSGNLNSGNRNSGDWNKTNFSGGCFNTVEHKIHLFNKPSEWTYRDWFHSTARCFLNQIPVDVLEYIYFDAMTDEEKAAHPEAETTGGYLKEQKTSKQERQAWWDKLELTGRDAILSIPNFDPDIFEEITMIHAHKDWKEYKRNAETETD